MLQFFRRHQKYFFIFTTVIIVFSFAFFGTYQAFSPGMRSSAKDERSYTAQMTEFLNTEQWMSPGKQRALNFLNDGVVSREFLETGMARALAEKQSERFASQLEELHEKERSYVPYKHPFLPGLGAESVWAMLAPDLPAKLHALQAEGAGFAEREALFLAERECPPSFLSQVMRYQEQSNPNMPQDMRLAKEDLALFGYHTLSDWFGEAFLESVAEQIIHIASLARKEGLKASKQEILSDLIAKSEEALKVFQKRQNLPVEDGYGFLQLYLRQIGMSESQLVKIWEDITLFRRLMHEVGDAALVDQLPLQKFYEYAYENATLELFQMPSELRFQSTDQLKRFEAYLTAVSDAKSQIEGGLPNQLASLQTIEQRAPELVGKRMRLYVAETSLKALEAKVSLKESLDWECQEANWKQIQQQFPELGSKEGAPFDVLMALEPKTRKLVDSFARKKVVELHPDWAKEALLSMDMEEKPLFLTTATEKPLRGIKDSAAFLKALEKEKELIGYSQDNTHFYRILVIDQGEEKELLPFKEAVKMEGMLDKLALRVGAAAKVDQFLTTLPADQKEQGPALRFAKYLEVYAGKEREQGGLFAQFPIEQKHKTITRADSSLLPLDSALKLAEGELSKVMHAPSEGAFMVRLVGHNLDKTIPMDKVLKSQQLLSQEARRCFFETLL